MPNVEELDALQAWLDQQSQLPDDESQWNQRFWRYTPELKAFLNREETVPECGTAYCAAGYVAWKNGAVWPVEIPVGDSMAGLYVKYDPKIDTAEVKTMYGVDVVPVGTRAAAILGINDGWADMLFSDSVDYDDMTEMLGEIKAGVSDDAFWGYKYGDADND